MTSHLMVISDYGAGYSSGPTMDTWDEPVIPR
jgi:hypothetical protein